MPRFLCRLTLVFILGLLTATQATSQSDDVTFRVVGWNLESGESDNDLLAKQVANKNGVHVWGFCEVANQNTLDTILDKANKNGSYKGILGKSGNGDRLAVVYDTKRFKVKGVEELNFITLAKAGQKTGQRAPLVVHLQGLKTGKEFLFVVNHLSRDSSGTPKRVQQAKLLNQWVRTVKPELPVVMVGDYNFDFDVKSGDAGKRDEGYDELIKDNKFVWVRPERLVKTQASKSFNTVLDFVFVGNVPFGWSAESHILNREDDEEATEGSSFKDDAKATDHRPVDAIFTLRPIGPNGGAVIDELATPSTSERESLKKEIAELKARLMALEKKLQQLEP